jgi:hypothetical protein
MEPCFRLASVMGLRGRKQGRRQCNAFDNSDRSAHIAAHRRIADLAIQCKLGYGPGGLLGTVLVVVLILALLGRV